VIHQCDTFTKTANYPTVRNVIRVIAENYSDPHLNLPRVSQELSMSTATTVDSVITHPLTFCHL
jgi:hypothetical protein